MWQVITKPDILIFLQCTFENSTARRKLNWLLSDYEEQQRRLSFAYEHAHLIIVTDSLTAPQVLKQVLDYLRASFE